MPPTGQQPHRLRHPLEPLTAEEIRLTAAAVRRHAEFVAGTVFVSTALLEPPKAAMAGFRDGRIPPRESLVVLYDGSRREVVETVVSPTDGTVRSWRPIPGVRPNRPGGSWRRRPR